MSNSVQNKRMTSLSVNESFIEKSIIAQLPDSPPQQQRVSEMEAQIGRLKEQLQYYKKEAYSKGKPEPFSFRDIEKGNASSEQGGNGQEAVLRQQNQQQKLIIKKLSQELRSKKKSDYGVDLAADCQRLQYINKKLQNDNAKIQSENEQLRKQLTQATSVAQGKGKDSGQMQQLRRKNAQYELKIAELVQANSEYEKQLQDMTIEMEKLRRENVIDRQTRKSSEYLRIQRGNGNSRYSIINMHNSRMSELELLENQRFALKLSEKNKEYEQLYLKFQSVENQLHAAQEINADLQRQRKFLAERLSDIEIHTEGDEIVGQLQNKLVLMSTELMRLGNLSRTKTQECKELTIRVKELVLKRENLEKDVIERDKLILNYKEEIRLVEMRSTDRSVMESRVERESNARQREKSGKLAKEIERLALLVKEKGEALKDSDIKNAILEQKNQRLQRENQELEKENKELLSTNDRNKEVHTKVLNLEAEVNYFKEANSALKGEMKRYQSKLYENRSDIDKLGREREETRTANQDLHERVRSMQQELRRTQLQLQEKNMELREINHKTEERVIFKSNEIKKLEEKIIILEKEAQRGSRTKTDQPRYEELAKEIHRLEGVELTLKLQISTYEEKLVMLAQENQRLNLIVKTAHQDKAHYSQLKLESEQRERKLRDLHKQVQSSSAREKRYKEENESLRQRLRETMVQERQGEGWQFKNRQLRDQIDGLRTQLSVREEQSRNLAERYRKQSSERYTLLLRNEELTARLSAHRPDNYPSDSNKDDYDSSLKALTNQARKKDERIAKLQEQAHENEQTYCALSEQIERLNLMLQQRTRDMLSYKKEIDFMQHKVKTCEESLRQRNVVQLASEKSIAEAESKTKIEICEGKIRNYEGEVELLRQRCDSLRREYATLEGRLSQATHERNLFEQRGNQIEYQLNQKSSNFRHVEDSFKLTILEIKKSNERLEQAMGQIENHYIGKLDLKEREYEQARSDRKSLESHCNELERKLAGLESQYGSEIKEKNLYINSLSTNHNQTREEIAEIRRIKGEYQVKISLLSQEIERLTEVKQRQRTELDRLHEEMRSSENRFSSSMRQSTANAQTIDVLSTEIERLNSVLVENVEKMRELSKKSAKSQMQCVQLAKDCELATRKAEDYERKAVEERQGNTDRMRKLDELNKELKYQLQEKTKDADRFLERIQALQKREQTETNEHMRVMADEMKLLREGNQKLEGRVGVITREYEQLVVQLEHYKRPRSNEGDEKMRIIGNYEATIKHMREENSVLDAARIKLQTEHDRINKISHELQERLKISEEKARVFEEKCRRFDEHCRVLEERSRHTEDVTKAVSSERSQVEQKMLSALEEVSRLQLIIKSKEAEMERLQVLLVSQSQQAQEYYESMRDKKGIFVIKEASEVDERSRSASGNGQQPQSRHPPNPHASDLQHRYELLETVNKKLSAEREAFRSKVSEYEYKMKKLKEEFDLINRLIHQYREENDKLKETNKALSLQARSNNFVGQHSHFSSPQHSSIKGNSFIEHPQRHLSPPPQPSRSTLEPFQDNAKAKLSEQIDRLNKVNAALQSQIHDLRLSSTDSIALRRRLQQNLSLVVILFAEVESLRSRLKEVEGGRRGIMSPMKGNP